MAPPRVVHVSPLELGDLLEPRRAELQRIFGNDVEIIEVSHLGVDARTLVEAIRQAEPDAVVLATAPPPHRQAIEGLAPETPVFRPMFERVRNVRGEMEERSAGLGLLREGGVIEPLPDGALGARSVMEQAIDDVLKEAQERRHP